jgi:hypothetical protein
VTMRGEENEGRVMLRGEDNFDGRMKLRGEE